MGRAKHISPPPPDARRTVNCTSRCDTFSLLVAARQHRNHRPTAGIAVGRLWLLAFDFLIPSYLAGVSGGLAAIPVWELLRWFDKK